MNGLKEARCSLITCDVAMVTSSRRRPWRSTTRAPRLWVWAFFKLAKRCPRNSSREGLPNCEEEKLGHYRPEVLTDSNYHADEDIDGD